MNLSSNSPHLQQEVGEQENWIREHRLAIKCCLAGAEAPMLTLLERFSGLSSRSG